MEIKGTTEFLENTACPEVYCESSADYTLPDYLPEMRKILFTDASVRPSGKFASADEVEFSGIVVYHVVYLDGEGKIGSLEFNSDYGYSLRCSGENYRDAFGDTQITAYSIRLVGPRRLSARTTVVGNVRLIERRVLSLSGNACSGDENPEIDYKPILIRSMSVSETAEREYADKIASLDGVIADDVSVVYLDAKPFDENVEREQDGVRIKGKIRLIGCIRVGESPAYPICKDIAFDESVSFDSLPADCHLYPKLIVTSVKSDVGANEGGCDLVASVILEMCAYAEYNEELRVATDGYLKSLPTESEYCDFSYQSLVDRACVSGTHTAEMPRGQIESEGLREILIMSASPKVERVEQSENALTILGEIKYSGVASEFSEDTFSYIPIKFSAPFATDVNICCQNDNGVSYKADVSVSDLSTSIDSEKLSFVCNLHSELTATCEKKQRILTSLNSTDIDSEECASITVYYPEEGDTLFSVAKKYRTSTAKLARDNDITSRVFAPENPEGVLSGIKKLIIY